MSIRVFPDWSDPRGLVLLGRRDERAVWWPSVVDETPMPSGIGEGWTPPTLTLGWRAPLAEDAARIAPLGVSALDPDIGAPRSFEITTDSGLRAVAPMPDPVWPRG